MKIFLSLSELSLVGAVAQSFLKWFGKSVVKKDGVPLVCYHGSKADIAFFDKKYLGAGNDENGVGFYFTDNPQMAEGYGNAIYPVYLRIVKPIYANKPPDATRRMVVALAQGVGLSLFKSFVKENLSPTFDRREIDEYFSALAGTDLINASFAIFNDVWDGTGKEEDFAECLKRVTGYDGVVVNRGEFKNYVVFSATQVKSAIGNRGTFKRNKNLVD